MCTKDTAGVDQYPRLILDQPSIDTQSTSNNNNNLGTQLVESQPIFD